MEKLKNISNEVELVYFEIIFRLGVSQFANSRSENLESVKFDNQ